MFWVFNDSFKKKNETKEGIKKNWSQIVRQKNDICYVWILILITAYASEKLPKYFPL